MTGIHLKAGLGLFTSYYIVQKHGGEIRVESKLGAGSTFTVELPTDGGLLTTYITVNPGRRFVLYRPVTDNI